VLCTEPRAVILDMVYNAVQAVMCACFLPIPPPWVQYLDSSAGAWDARLGERLVKLALWCCMHNPAERPALTVVASDLHRLAEQAASAEP
jgi:hypothetical protein